MIKRRNDGDPHPTEVFHDGGDERGDRVEGSDGPGERGVLGLDGEDGGAAAVTDERNAPAMSQQGGRFANLIARRTWDEGEWMNEWMVLQRLLKRVDVMYNLLCITYGITVRNAVVA